MNGWKPSRKMFMLVLGSKSASPQVDKSASPQVDKSASPQVCKSASQKQELGNSQ